MQLTVPPNLRQALARLELISQVNAVNLDPSSRDAGEDIGGKRPPGGIDRRDDREQDFPQKSVEHFKRRLHNARSAHQVELILRDAEAALVAWRRQPAPTGELEYGSPQWKRWVGESTLTAEQIASKYNVSRRYIARVKAAYATAA